MYQFKSPLAITLLAMLLFISACSEQSVNKSKSAEKADMQAEPVISQPKSKILYITSVGWFHDYQRQIDIIGSNISKFVDADIDVIVGDVEYLKANDFSKGYDLLIYNFCHAAQRDDELVQSLISPVTEKGVPLIALHCAMHSFQFDNQWAKFLGLHTLRHEKQRSLAIEKMGSHALVNTFPDSWTLTSDELYITISQNEHITPLLQSYGIETKKNHTQAWLFQSGKGQVVGTTLGHNESTLENINFQRFLGNSVQYLLGSKLTEAATLPFASTVNLLSKSVSYPQKAEKQCVIHNMFSIGGEKVKSCIASQCTDSSKLAECTTQCQQDNPWPVPESLREACQNNELTVPK